MGTFIIVALIIYAVVKLTKKKHTRENEKIANGDLDNIINQIMANYEFIRSHRAELEADMIIINTLYFIDGDKIDAGSSALLSVKVYDKTGTVCMAARNLGLETVRDPESGVYYHQLRIRGGLNGNQKKTLLQRTAQKLMERYPNDLMKLDNSMLIGMVDCRDSWELVQGSFR